MVRLKGAGVALGSEGHRFQFLMVRLKVFSGFMPLVCTHKFQFLMVRLKALNGSGDVIVTSSFNSLWFD